MSSSTEDLPVPSTWRASIEISGELSRPHGITFIARPSHQTLIDRILVIVYKFSKYAHFVSFHDTRSGGFRLHHSQYSCQSIWTFERVI